MDDVGARLVGCLGPIPILDKSTSKSSAPQTAHESHETILDADKNRGRSITFECQGIDMDSGLIS